MRRAIQPERPAGVVTRTLAAAVDAIVVWLIVAGGYLGWAIFKLIIDPRQFSWPDAAWWISMAAAMFVATLYLPSAGRARPHDRRRALRHQGHQFPAPDVRWVTSLIRAGMCVVFPIGLAWSLVDRRRRSIQDILIRSAVIYDWSTRTRAQVDEDAAELMAQSTRAVAAPTPTPAVTWTADRTSCRSWLTGCS